MPAETPAAEATLAKPLIPPLPERVYDHVSTKLNPYSPETIARDSEAYLKKKAPTLTEIKTSIANTDIQTLQSLDEIRDYTNAHLHLEGASDAELQKKLPIVFALLNRALALSAPSNEDGTPQGFYDSQLQAAITLNEGKLAQMRTSEGKTYALELAAALNGLTKKGVHVVSSNPYLVCRDVANLGEMYGALGLSVAVLTDELDTNGQQIQYIYDPTLKKSDHPQEPHLKRISRYEAYRADITYGTPREFIFDYLRDKERPIKVQRDFNCALVDEADDTLIDQAIKPFINAQPETLSPQERTMLMRINTLPLYVKNNYTILSPERKQNAQIELTEEGETKVRELFGEWGYDYDDPAIRLAVNNTFKAHILFQRDKDYVVSEKSGLDEEIILLDTNSTGRSLEGTRFSNGLHQALEAKEYLRIRPDNITLNSITAMQYFRLYKKLGATTATATSAAKIFKRFYNLDVIAIPTRNTIRLLRYETRGIYPYDKDRIIIDPQTQQETLSTGMFHAITEDAEGDLALGRPILIGTAPGDIAKADALAAHLRERFAGRIASGEITLSVLHARNDSTEADIVSHMGEKGHITISAGLAGRGTDAQLGTQNPNLFNTLYDTDGFFTEHMDSSLANDIQDPTNTHDAINAAGGLVVYAIDVPTTKRVLDQLIGRTARAGDNGTWRLYVSKESQLFQGLTEETIQRLSRAWQLESKYAGTREFFARLDAMIEMLQIKNEDEMLQTLEQSLYLQHITQASRKPFEDLDTNIRSNPLAAQSSIILLLHQFIISTYPNTDALPLSEDLEDPNDPGIHALVGLQEQIQHDFPILSDINMDTLFTNNPEIWKSDSDAYKTQLTDLILKHMNERLQNLPPQEHVLWCINICHQAIQQTLHDISTDIQNIYASLTLSPLEDPINALLRRIPQLETQYLEYLKSHLVHILMQELQTLPKQKAPQETPLEHQETLLPPPPELVKMYQSPQQPSGTYVMMVTQNSQATSASEPSNPIDREE